MSTILCCVAKNSFRGTVTLLQNQLMGILYIVRVQHILAGSFITLIKDKPVVTGLYYLMVNPFIFVKDKHRAVSSVVMSTIPKRKHKRSDIEANYRNETKTF
jgi:hypothetical protein